ncbi:hypothetical protein ACF1GT_18995 [Streptomyces sp. NPDC014636]|uniref:hypothetical protein n=1 Tax=Streptomyces sp. NPDC014636 TaxID=3364876 RepID=UPI0036FC0150
MAAVLSLSDGYGIRLMLRDPTVTLDTALTAIRRHVSAALGLPETLPEVQPVTGPWPADR